MLEGLQERFRAEFLRTARGRLDRALSALESLATEPTVRNEMHALAGEAALIGFQEVAEAARAAEKLAKAALQGDVVAQGKCARAFRKVKRAVEVLAEPPKPKALVIDDSELICEQLQLALTSRGFEVKTASSGALGLAAASAEVDLVVVDFNLPGMDCAELVSKLRPLAPRAHVALVSGLDGSELAARASEVGADSGVSKVEGLDAIADRLAGAVGSRRK